MQFMGSASIQVTPSTVADVGAGYHPIVFHCLLLSSVVADVHFIDSFVSLSLVRHLLYEYGVKQTFACDPKTIAVQPMEVASTHRKRTCRKFVKGQQMHCRSWQSWVQALHASRSKWIADRRQKMEREYT